MNEYFSSFGKSWLLLLLAMLFVPCHKLLAADYVKHDYLNDVVCTTDQAYTRIYKEPTLEDPSFAIFMFIKDSENGKRCVTWGGYEDQNKNILPTIYIDGQYFAQPGWEMCWLNTAPNRNVDTWWDTENDKASIYTKEINGVTWTLRFNDVQRCDSRYYFVKMYFCPSEIEGGSKHTITVKGRLTEYVGEDTPSTTNYLDVERDFVFDMPKLITSNPVVSKEEGDADNLSVFANLAAGAEKHTYFGVYVNDGTVNGFVPYNQLDGKQELPYATTFSSIKYTIPEEYKDKDLRVQMHRDFSGLLGNEVSVCHYYNYHDWLYSDINTVHHEVAEPTTYTTRGFNQECWENMTTGKYYSDATCTLELSPAQVFAYKKLISTPVTANKGFTLVEDAAYGGVQFNWAAETTYKTTSVQYSETGTRSVEFTVYGKDVDNARVKWNKNSGAYQYGKFTITVYVNGTKVYSINQEDDKSLSGFFAVPLQGLKKGDVVKFEVQKPKTSGWVGNVTIAACLEYTSSDGGEREKELIHHYVVEPTYETVGNIEYWEDNKTGKYYSDATCVQELNPEMLITYKKLKSNPATANNGFTIKNATYEGVQFNWVAETTYKTTSDPYSETGTRSVEFTVYGTDVDNARVKWNKNSGAYQYGKFTITVYVNGTKVYSVNQDDNKSLSGLFAVPLQGLKKGDKVKFEVQKPKGSDWAGNVTIAACLEYTSSNGGLNENIIHHDAVEPEYETVGNIEYWENKETGKYYSDAECTQELSPADVVTYKKLNSNPVTANNGFTIKDAAYSDVQFNWAAETTYKTTSDLLYSETGTRSVEFTLYGTDVDNARMKWNKDNGDYRYGKFTITIYVNGAQVYSVNQNDRKSLEGYFVVPLQGLKTGDVVKFEVQKTSASQWASNVTIAACLEYTSSNGGLNEDIIHHDAVEPEYETVGNIEYWEDKKNGKYYSDIFFMNELNPEMLIAYKKLISNPVTANNGFTLKDAAYGGVQFDWAAETTYKTKSAELSDTDTRSVEFIVYGTDVDNARVKWNKNSGAYQYGKFTLTVYVNGTQVYSINQDDNKSLSGFFAVPLQGLKKGDVVKFEVKKPEKSEWPGNVTIAACLEYTSSNGGEAIHHEVAEPTTYTTRGFNQECWEAFNFYKFYSDAACTQELNPAQLITYKKLFSNPVTANNGFTIKDAAYDGVQFNWAAETTYRQTSGAYSDTDTRSVEFIVYGTDVDNARVKWYKNNGDYQYGDFTITVYVNGTKVYSINQADKKSLSGLFAVPLQGLKTGDVVKFEVKKPYYSDRSGNVTIAACLEYTSSNGGRNPEITITADDNWKNKGDDDPELTWKVTKGELIEGDELTEINIWRETGENGGFYPIHVSQEEGSNPKYNITFVDGVFRIIDAMHHDAVEPEYETVGNIEYWEDRPLGKYYSDAECSQELSPAQVFTYKKLKSSPVTANSGFTFKDAAYGGVQFNWAAETTYKTTSALDSEKGTRSVEFTLYGTDVDNARVKWYKNNGDYRYGKFTITVYVNGTQVYSVNQDDNKSLSGFFAVPLQGLKTGDKVKFEVQKPKGSNWAGNVTIAACLEYTSSDGGLNEDIIHHDAVEPEYETVGNIEYWEDKTGKYYSDIFLNELNPEMLITYKKLISLPVTANNGFTIKDAAYSDVQFNWVAETTYKTTSASHSETGTRSVEFTVYGTDVDKARVKWYKNNGDYQYGQFTINVYVNGTQVYFVNQNDNKSLSGLFAVPLQGLKTGDVVKFEVKKPEGSYWTGNVTIAACLEYTSSNGGLNEDIIHHDAVEPEYETVGNIEYWEDKKNGKYYSDIFFMNELNPEMLITYKKLISNPVTAHNSAFTLKEDATYEGAQFNWAAETTYGRLDKDTRSVEFTVFGKDVDNARVKWTKNNPDWRYGKLIINVYVNGTQVYSINQGENDLGGLFAILLPDLKTGDKVIFEIKKESTSYYSNNPTVTIAACLEYTSSNGGEGMLITANQDPDHTENYYSTFYSSTDAYQLPGSVTAYTGRADGNVLHLTAIEGSVIPAGEPVILRLTTADNAATQKQIALALTTSSVLPSDSNTLVGTDTETVLEDDCFALSCSPEYGVGFYSWSGMTIGAHKAYLNLAQKPKAMSYVFVFDDGTTTGTEQYFESQSEQNKVPYNLQGMPVDESYRGLIILDGKLMYKE